MTTKNFYKKVFIENAFDAEKTRRTVLKRARVEVKGAPVRNFFVNNWLPVAGAMAVFVSAMGAYTVFIAPSLEKARNNVIVLTDERRAAEMQNTLLVLKTKPAEEIKRADICISFDDYMTLSEFNEIINLVEQEHGDANSTVTVTAMYANDFVTLNEAVANSKGTLYSGAKINAPENYILHFYDTGKFTEVNYAELFHNSFIPIPVVKKTTETKATNDQTAESTGNNTETTDISSSSTNAPSKNTIYNTGLTGVISIQFVNDSDFIAYYADKFAVYRINSDKTDGLYTKLSEHAATNPKNLAINAKYWSAAVILGDKGLYYVAESGKVTEYDLKFDPEYTDGAKATVFLTGDGFAVKVLSLDETKDRLYITDKDKKLVSEPLGAARVKILAFVGGRPIYVPKSDTATPIYQNAADGTVKELHGIFAETQTFVMGGSYLTFDVEYAETDEETGDTTEKSLTYDPETGTFINTAELPDGFTAKYTAQPKSVGKYEFYDIDGDGNLRIITK
ncbi:MAG: hypothetical protein LBN42_02870 [Oscillospiraceae bacterium]|jgi:hypothetical protein|nr:hypothetical protein [Oscillospiraceae bacterium]